MHFTEFSHLILFGPFFFSPKKRLLDLTQDGVRPAANPKNGVWDLFSKDGQIEMLGYFKWIDFDIGTCLNILNPSSQ